MYYAEDKDDNNQHRHTIECSKKPYPHLKWKKRTATTHTELKSTYMGVNDGDGTRRFQEMCLLIPANSERFSGLCSGINNNAPLRIDHGQ